METIIVKKFTIEPENFHRVEDRIRELTLGISNKYGLIESVDSINILKNRINTISFLSVKARLVVKTISLEKGQRVDDILIDLIKTTPEKGTIIIGRLFGGRKEFPCLIKTERTDLKPRDRVSATIEKIQIDRSIQSICRM